MSNQWKVFIKSKLYVGNLEKHETIERTGQQTTEKLGGTIAMTIQYCLHKITVIKNFDYVLSSGFQFVEIFSPWWWWCIPNLFFQGF